MDAHALLSSQGWRGTGHSLHMTDDSIGLAKPLLLSRKDNKQGLGQKQHFTSDQWWMNAFDEQLKGLDTSKKGKVIQTVTSGKLNSLDKNQGKYSVYTSFVRGGFLEGTIKHLQIKDSSASADSTESSDDNADPKTKNTDSKLKTETKEERRARREAKRNRKEERAREKAARRERRKLRKSKKSSAESSDADDEKRRRRARKEEKRRQRTKEAEK
jgi:nucleolar protein TMA23